MGEMISGVLNVDKPQGWTSHDVVARVRQIANQRRVGHTGTLDPMARGVLLICLGRATRIAEYLTDTHKRYCATIRFGIETDTWDAEGTVVSERAAGAVTRSAVEAALPHFRGAIQQVPPMYSALKYQGQPLHRLARRGTTVERPARHIIIHRLDIVSWEPPDLGLMIECSKGTYIRSLAHDLGQMLGVGAHLVELVRTAVGPFALPDAVSLETLAAEAQGDCWGGHLLSMFEALSHLPHVIVDEARIGRLRHGQAVVIEPPMGASLCCAYDSQHRLVAVLHPGTEDGLWQPRKVFAA
jgi:tRNA pseudouridine55 synthase